jgi:hypothetical protein
MGDSGMAAINTMRAAKRIARDGAHRVNQRKGWVGASLAAFIQAA